MAYHFRVSIQGMTCGHCVDTVTRGLIENLPGASSVSVDLDAREARLTLPQAAGSLTDLKNKLATAIEDLGYDAGTPELMKGDDEEKDDQGAHVTLSLTGLTCSHCTNTVEKALKELPGVKTGSIHVDLDQATFVLLARVPQDKLVQTIEDLGYDVEAVRFRRRGDPDSDHELDDQIKSASLLIGGMTCSHCTRTVTAALQSLPGVIQESVQVDLERRSAALLFQGDAITADVLTETIQDIGYDVEAPPRLSHAPKQAQVSDRASVASSTGSIGLRKVVMRVVGMTCQSCIAAVTDALEQGVQGIQKETIQVDLQTDMASFVCHNPKAEQVRRAIEDRGYGIENIQIIYNLVPPAALDDRPPQSSSASILSLGAVHVETPVLALPKKVTMLISGMTCAR